MNNHIKISMLLNSSRTNKKVVCSIKCRITFSKERKEFSTGLFVNPKCWNSKKLKILDDTEQSDNF